MVLQDFIESARIGSNQANTGLNYECDAIAACVIGGVSFVGGTGKISGIVLGVFYPENYLRCTAVPLNQPEYAVHHQRSHHPGSLLYRYEKIPGS